MTRTGKFTPSRRTENQCKAPGHKSYDYTLRMVFLGNMKLDEHQFITDHANVDGLIQNMDLTGSCEQMHLKICGKLKEFFRKKAIPLCGCKCTIHPGEGAAAYMDYYFIDDSTPTIVSLLN